MDLHLTTDLRSDTSNRSAFELVNAAHADIARFTTTRDQDRLATAQKRLEEAEKLDPRYLRVFYLKGIVRDLAGAPLEAIPYLEMVLSAARPPFAHEVRYNLAIAYYHRYHAPDVDQAIALFDQVIADEEAAPSLRLLAMAGRAQAFAMRMIPRFPDQPERERIAELFDRVAVEKHDALRRLKKVDVAAVAAEVRWMVHNAVGMSLMYYSDYFGSTTEKGEYVQKALEHLTLADHDSPKNWANYCDLGSAHMRLGYWRGRDPEEFERALHYLRNVVDDLRQEYGFALYEIGRLYRINRQFDRAIEWLGKAFAVPQERRDVGNARLDFEIDLVKQGDAEYPCRLTSSGK